MSAKDKTVLSVTDALEVEMADLFKRAPELAEGTLAAIAFRLAVELDASDNSATQKAACAKELREVLMALQTIAPAEEKIDKLDELAERRVARRTAT